MDLEIILFQFRCTVHMRFQNRSIFDELTRQKLYFLFFGPPRRHITSIGRNSSVVELRWYKKAELSQRWPRDAPYIWVPCKFSGVPEYAHGYTFPEIFNWLLRTKFEVRCFTIS